MKTKWNELSVKEKLAIGSACVAFILGWFITFIAAFIPILLSEQGVLWILGQSLVYAGSVFGIAAYFKAESVQMKNDLKQFFMEKEELQDERFKLRQGIDGGEIYKDE